MFAAPYIVLVYCAVVVFYHLIGAKFALDQRGFSTRWEQPTYNHLLLVLGLCASACSLYIFAVSVYYASEFPEVTVGSS